jgi:hypothetical protein
MQATVRPEVREFFERFERAGRELDPDAVMGSYAESFLSLDSSSAHALTPQALVSVLPRRQALFESIGGDGMELGHIEETPLDDDHTLVRTSWTLRRRPRLPSSADHLVVDVRAAPARRRVARRPLPQPPGHAQAIRGAEMSSTTTEPG